MHVTERSALNRSPVDATNRHGTPVPLGTLPEQWRALAADLRRFGAEPQARTLDSCADELAGALRARADEALTLRQAATESGYSVDHLGRLIRDGKIPNAGDKARPRIRRSTLPAKPGSGGKKRDKSTEVAHIPGRLFRDIIQSKFGGDDAQS